MRIGLVAGETSGDLLGAGLIREIRQRHPGTRFEGVGGPAMQAAGCDAWESSEALAVMGLIEPLREIPRLLKLRRMLVKRWCEVPPDVFIGIDAPDFNLGLERRLKTNGIRTVHYVSPSVWAWRQSRVRKISSSADRVLCLLPFEKAFYDRHGIAADFVGHPMADSIPPNLDPNEARAALGIPVEKVVAVLPGSRMSEVSRLGPVFAEACAKLGRAIPELGFVAPMVNDRLQETFTAHLEAANVKQRFTLTRGDAQTAIAAADVVLLASGTAALQAALVGRPMIAAYKVSALTYGIVQLFDLIKVPHVTLPNHLTEKPMVPEYIQGKADANRLAKAVAGMLGDPERRERIQAAFAEVREELAQGADQRAADSVLELAGGGD